MLKNVVAVFYKIAPNDKLKKVTLLCSILYCFMLAWYLLISSKNYFSSSKIFS